MPRTPNVVRAKQPKVLTDFDKIGEGAMIFTDTYKGKPRLNVHAHGVYTEQLGMGTIKIDGIARDPMWLVETLQERGVDFSKYSNARILACQSANEGAVSFASYFSRYSGLPTKGYKGNLWTRTYWLTLRDQIRIGPQAGIKATSYIPFVDKYRENHMIKGFEFKPVKFRPD